MHKYLVLLFCLCGSLAFSQRLVLEPGLGVGTAHYSVPSDGNSKSRIMLFANVHYAFTGKWSAGISAYTADNFIKSVGGYPFNDEYDAGTRTMTLDPRNITTNSVLATLRYTHAITEEVKVFGEWGTGVTTAVRKYPLTSVPTVKRQALAIQPRVGIVLGKASLSLLYQWGGRTPVFNSVDPDTQDNVRMQSIRTSAIMLSASYRISLIK